MVASSPVQYHQRLTRGGCGCAQVMVLAKSPPQNGVVKLFLFAQEVRIPSVRHRRLAPATRALSSSSLLTPLPPSQAASQAYHLVECVHDANSRTASVTVKSDTRETAPAMLALLRSLLASAGGSRPPLADLL